MTTSPQVLTLLGRIVEAHSELVNFVLPLHLPEIVAPQSDGWSVRDHLVHVAAWELSLLALLRGESRLAAIGLTEAEDADLNVDEINQRILDAAQDQTWMEVLVAFDAGHADVLEQIESMSDADLLLPYSHFQPAASGAEEDQPVLGYITGNTFEHYEEHLGWLRATGVGHPG